MLLYRDICTAICLKPLISQCFGVNVAFGDPLNTSLKRGEQYKINFGIFKTI